MRTNAFEDCEVEPKEFRANSLKGVSARRIGQEFPVTGLRHKTVDFCYHRYG